MSHLRNRYRKPEENYYSIQGKQYLHCMNKALEKSLHQMKRFSITLPIINQQHLVESKKLCELTRKQNELIHKLATEAVTLENFQLSFGRDAALQQLNSSIRFHLLNRLDSLIILNLHINISQKTGLLRKWLSLASDRLQRLSLSMFTFGNNAYTPTLSIDLRAILQVQALQLFLRSKELLFLLVSHQGTKKLKILNLSHMELGSPLLTKMMLNFSERSQHLVFPDSALWSAAKKFFNYSRADKLHRQFYERTRRVFF